MAAASPEPRVPTLVSMLTEIHGIESLAEAMRCRAGCRMAATGYPLARAPLTPTGRYRGPIPGSEPFQVLG